MVMVQCNPLTRCVLLGLCTLDKLQHKNIVCINTTSPKIHYLFTDKCFFILSFHLKSDFENHGRHVEV